MIWNTRFSKWRSFSFKFAVSFTQSSGKLDSLLFTESIIANAACLSAQYINALMTVWDLVQHLELLPQRYYFKFAYYIFPQFCLTVYQVLSKGLCASGGDFHWIPLRFCFFAYIKLPFEPIQNSSILVSNF